MIKPPDHVISRALAAAAKSPCAKSKRGVAVFVGEEVISLGFNGPPEPLTCDSSALCRRDCGKRCVHAEVRAIRHVANFPLKLAARIQLVHVELATDGGIVACDGPSCWQCSREILDAGIGGIWLFEEYDPYGGGAWHFYDALEFHQATLLRCDIGGPR